MLMGLLLLVFVKQNVDVELMATAQTTSLHMNGGGQETISYED